MSDGNIEVVQRIYEAFGAGDVAGIIALQAEDTVWDHSGPPGNPLNRVFEGHAGVGEFFEILGGTQEALEFEPKEFFASGDRAPRSFGSFLPALCRQVLPFSPTIG